jgi:EAL domain-containing protein (putative c-di-GMP-specific phosphodiesterase class I)
MGGIMKIVTSDAEHELLDYVKSKRGIAQPQYALLFHLSGLQEQFRSEFQMRIALNVLHDVFRAEAGAIFSLRSGDLFVFYDGSNRKLLEKSIFQLRYLFTDDPLAYQRDGSDNPQFCTLFDVSFQWRALYRVCSEIVDSLQEKELFVETAKHDDIRPAPVQPDSDMAYSSAAPVTHQSLPFTWPDKLNWHALPEVMRRLTPADVGYAMRKQPICAIKQGQLIRKVYYETYVHLSHLQKLIDVPFHLTSDPWLFRYLTKQLDGHVLDIIAQNPKTYGREAFALNLHVSTILSPEFLVFYEAIKQASGVSLVVEISVSDVFSDMAAFLRVLDFAKEKGIRTCLDGLTNESFVQFDRGTLGVDLVKLQWNADVKGDLDEGRNKRLREVIERCGSNRMILCRCDSSHAIEYGHALGITLFQGRYPDKILDPDATVIN